MKKLLTAILCLTFLNSCGDEASDNATSKNNGGSEQTAVSNDQPLDKASLVGTYEGTLPCDGCEGINTSIILNENNTYYITAQPIGDSAFSMPVTDTGNFVMHDTVLELTDAGGEVINYKIEANSLQQLGSDGQPLQASGKGNYILNKK